MLIVYDSLTGNVQRFIKKLGMRSVKISNDLRVNEPFVLVTYTIGFGEVPPSVSTFLKDNYHCLRAVAVSGNQVWGSNYGKAGDSISNQYQVPLLLKFELSGTQSDIETFLRGVEESNERTNSEMAEVK